jgi:hypothetical protein
MQVAADQAKKVVLALGKALNDQSFELARRYVNDDIRCAFTRLDVAGR